MQSLELLKARRYRAGDRSESYALPGRWREQSAAQGEQWLRQRAQEGDCFAMERMAERFLWAENKKEEGTLLLRHAASSGSVNARYLLSIYLLDSAAGPDAEGWALLRQAADEGFHTAVRELGLRLLMNNAATRSDLTEGGQWLRSAAASGDRLAMIFLGRFLNSGRFMRSSPREGADWLACAGAGKSTDVPRLGLLLYRRALNEPSPAIRKRFCDEAAALFLEGHHNSDMVSSMNLGYMVRRGDVPADSFPLLDSLFQIALKQANSFAIVNEALRKAAGKQCPVDWKMADEMIQRLPGTMGVLEWWLTRSQSGDPEGHLVLGWLVQHGLTADPDDLEPCQRFAMVSRDDWNIPKWMED
jgi:TPR repeat protein